MYSFVFQYQDLSANPWHNARPALAYFALSFTSYAAPSSFVPRFQRSGFSSFFFRFLSLTCMFGLVAVLFAAYAFNRLLPSKLEVWE